MLYDKEGNCMNENEMNVQNVGNNQPINPNVGMPQPNNANMGGISEQNIGVVQSQAQPVASMSNLQTVPGQENINMGIPQSPIPQTPVASAPLNNGSVGPIVPPTNNIMEDFSQAVVPEPVMQTVNVAPTMPAVEPANPTPAPAPNSGVVEPQTTAPIPPVQENAEQVAVQNTDTIVPIPTETAVEMSTQAEETNPASTAVAEENPKKKKKGNWAFIIALFAVVGFFVLLLPLLVRIFGY